MFRNVIFASAFIRHLICIPHHLVGDIHLHIKSEQNTLCFVNVLSLGQGAELDIYRKQ